MLDKQFCTACRACVNICPINAIQMVPDSEGFFYPEISDNCLNCDTCERICPQLSSTELLKRSKPQNGRLAVGKDSDLINFSSSGGAFAIFAKYIIEVKNGVVFGAYMDSDFFVRHGFAQKIEEIKPMQGSKYVQSNIEFTYKECKIFLDNGRYVLFSGTPCQLAGLKAYLGKYYEKLLTVDIVCHGVSAPFAFKEYIRWLENKTGKTIIKYRFRNRTPYDRSGFIVKIDYIDNLGNQKSILCNKNLDIFFRVYLDGKIFRKSCYLCSYARNERISDITIGDCNSSRFYRNFHPYEASSIVLLNTIIGENFWKKVSEQFDNIELDVDRELKLNSQLHEPSKKPMDRNIVCQDFANGLFEKYEKEIIYDISFLQRIRFWVQCHIPVKYRMMISTPIKKMLKGKIE